MKKYSKIETLFNRDNKTFKIKENEIRSLEFANVIRWSVTEKIDGTNIRVIYRPNATEPLVGVIQTIRETLELAFRGRSDKAKIPLFLIEYLIETFTIEKLKDTFPELERNVTLYGEGYGARLQKGGGNYRSKDVSFRLFDVKIDNWWLEPESIEEIAKKLGIKTVPSLGIMTLQQAIDFIKTKPTSLVSKDDGGNIDYPMEGIVARSYPLMLKRNGKRVIWKLKQKDFIKDV